MVIVVVVIIIIIIIIVIIIIIIIIIIINRIQTGLFLASLDWVGGGGVKRPPPFLKNYRRYRHEIYTTN